MANLARLATEASEDPNNFVRISIASELRVIGHGLRFLRYDGAGEHPVLTVLQQVWPAVDACLAVFCHDEEVVAAVCDGVNNVLRVAKVSVEPATMAIANTMATAFNLYPQTMWLDLAISLHAVLGRSPAALATLLTLYSRLRERMLTIFQAEQHVHHPELVASFFNLVTRVYRSNGEYLCGIDDAQAPLQLEATLQAIDWALYALTLPELSSVSAACHALRVLLELAGKHAEFGHALLASSGMHGKLVHTCIEAVVIAAAKASIADLAAVLWELKEVMIARSCCCTGI